MSKLIPLTQGQFAIVDDEDYDHLNQFKWCAHYYKHVKCFYASRNSKIGEFEKRKELSMHREIMCFPENMFIDHINHNTLDNRRCNLRICTKDQNALNRNLHRSNKSGYKGVAWNKSHGKWNACITINKNKMSLGWFNDKIKAAKAYDIAAKKFHGEFAKLNFPK